jgi:pimeloyl-ACP methyl ester carboxylesterase
VNGFEWNHQYLDANSLRIHYVRHGEGLPLVLLHGWPEFWLTWRKNIPPLAEGFDVVAPDLRGFGDSDKPALPDPPGDLLKDYVEDLRGLADALSFERFGIVSHDVGAYVAQAFARGYPERLSGLFFFNCPYPGIGERWAEADHVNEIWYQSFNQQPWAASLVGENHKTCGTYIRHFLDHWSYKPGLFDDDLDLWVENFMKPGNLQAASTGMSA